MTQLPTGPKRRKLKMMKAELLNIGTGKAKGCTLSDDIFSLEPRKDILHRVIKWQLARRQQGTHSVKTRSEGSYSKSKIYRQRTGAQGMEIGMPNIQKRGRL